MRNVSEYRCIERQNIYFMFNNVFPMTNGETQTQMIILRWIFRKWEGVVGTGWSWLRIGTGGGHL